MTHLSIQRPIAGTVTFCTVATNFLMHSLTDHQMLKITNGLLWGRLRTAERVCRGLTAREPCVHFQTTQSRQDGDK